MTRFLVAFLLVCFALPAAAQQQPFVVENVKINMKGVNPVEARDQARQAAQVKAFKALFKSLNKGEPLEFDESRVPSLIEDFELVDEQIAPNRYAATYTFRFNRSAAQEMAREAQYNQGMPANKMGIQQAGNQQQDGPSYQGPNYSQLYNGEQPQSNQSLTRQNNHIIQARANQSGPQNAKPPLLLPYWKAGESLVLWGQHNEWQKTWQRLESGVSGPREFLLPIGDLTDMRQTSGRLPESREALSGLLARYQTDQIVVAVGQRAASSITTTLYRADESGLSFWKVIDSPMGPATDPYSVAAGQVLAEMSGDSNPADSSRIPVAEGRFNEQEQNAVVPHENEPFFTAASAPVQTTIRAESHFDTPKEWLELKANMIPANGIREVRVLSLTPKSAMMELQLSEPVDSVQRNLVDRSVALKEHGDGSGAYVVRFMGS